MSRHLLNRREFLQASAAAASATLVAACTVPPPPTVAKPASGLPRRALGKTGEELSVVGFGGIVVDGETQEVAGQLVAQAVERGINYFDVAPQYGIAETRLGPALEPYRRSVFLACKTLMRNKAAAAAELRRSLERLRTDHFDLYQFHAVTHMSEVETILGPGGALEAFLEAREQGLIRYIGFSAHSEEAALAMLDGFVFDTVLYPVNWVCWHRGDFGPRVVEKAQEKGVAILALKALAKQPRVSGQPVRWPKCWYQAVENLEEATQGLRFTLSRPVTAAVSPSHAELLWWACDAAEQFRPLTEEEETQLALQSQELEPLFTAT